MLAQDRRQSFDPMLRRESRDPQATWREDAPSLSPLQSRKGSDVFKAPSGDEELEKKIPTICGLKLRIPLAVLFMVSTLAIASAVSVAIGVIAIVKGDQSVAQTADQLIKMTAERAMDRTNMMISTAKSLLYTTANSTLMYNFFNGDTQTNVLSRHLLDPMHKNVVSLHWHLAKQNSVLSASGFYFEGNSNYMAAYAPAGFIAVSDETTREVAASVNGYHGERCVGLNGTPPYNFTQPSGKVITITGTCMINSTGVNGYDVDGGLKYNPGLPFRADWDMERIWPNVYSSEGQPVWAPMTYSNNPMLMTFLVPLVQPLWYGYPVGTKGPGKFFAAQFVTMTLNSLENYLPTIKPTPNAVISFLDTKGLLIASSEPGATANLTTGVRYPAYNSTNPTIAATAQYLFPEYKSSTSSDYAKAVSEAKELSTEFIGPDKKRYLLQSRWVSDPHGLKWLMLLTVPRSDFFSAVDSAKKSILAIGVSLGFLGFLCAIFTSVIIILPLKRLISVMNDATNFDFSALRNGYLNRRSMFVEIAEMQEVFSVMMVKFASAIQSNKALVGRRVGEGSANPGSSSVPNVNAGSQVRESRQLGLGA
ncbi:hypothetical protein HK097_000858 [Rhizophlyctis rosea]|uniref:Uncharacterized protein n=1 Tax=Rhizophlyctis rosea TaxID=64517 RepID=A0AAD5WYM1_9FUNG|nr:hypothetical protein HK097_000858 [Rhizophlyctis rosea]